MPGRSNLLEKELEKVGDAEEFGMLFGNAEDEKGKSTGAMPAEQRALPATLLETMNANGSRWNAIFRFAVRLRSSRGGCDTQFLPNARHARRCSRKLNWHQYLEILWASFEFSFSHFDFNHGVYSLKLQWGFQCRRRFW